MTQHICSAKNVDLVISVSSPRLVHTVRFLLVFFSSSSFANNKIKKCIIMLRHNSGMQSTTASVHPQL